MLTIGDRIKYFRKRRGITQAQLAELTGIHPVSIRKYETNKMQPQSAQIERIAEALHVNSGAISESGAEIIQLKTVGDLMGLLMNWHKSGIMRIEGKRGANKLLEGSSVHLVPSPALRSCLAVPAEGKKEETIRLDSLRLNLPDEIFTDLLRWESIYCGYHQMKEKYGDSEDQNIQAGLDDLTENLEQIEMELQGNMALLK